MASVITIQQVDRQLKGLLRQYPVESLTVEERRYVKQLKQLINEARLDVRDYDFAQTRVEQDAHGKNALQRIRKLVETILNLSSVFGPADIAQLTAQLEQIGEDLQ